MILIIVAFKFPIFKISFFFLKLVNSISNEYIIKHGLAEITVNEMYTPEERKKRIEKFLEKRRNRVWTKKVKYDVRKVSLRLYIICILYII